MKKWQYVKLGDVCTKGNSNIAQKDLENNNGCYPIYGASGFIKNIDFYQQEKEYIAIVKDGAGVGRAMLLSAKSSVIGTMQYIIPNDVVNIEYLYYAIVNMNLARCYSGATIPHIYFKDYQKETFKLPSLKEQAKIAKVFNRIVVIIDQRKQQLQKLDELVKARFVEMFGDTVNNTLGWEEHCLDEYIEFLTSGSRGWAQYFNDNGSEIFITIKNVKNNNIVLDGIQRIDAPNNKEAERTKVQSGDLLISITADLGRTGVVDETISNSSAYINQHLSLIRLNKMIINPMYVSYFLETEGGKRQFAIKNQSAVKAGLNFEAIKSLKILVPPIEIQNKFVDFVQQINKSKLSVQNSLNKLEMLKKSLMQKYFG